MHQNILHYRLPVTNNNDLWLAGLFAYSIQHEDSINLARILYKNRIFSRSQRHCMITCPQLSLQGLYVEYHRDDSLFVSRCHRRIA